MVKRRLFLVFIDSTKYLSILLRYWKMSHVAKKKRSDVIKFLKTTQLSAIFSSLEMDFQKIVSIA